MLTQKQGLRLALREKMVPSAWDKEQSDLVGSILKWREMGSIQRPCPVGSGRK